MARTLVTSRGERDSPFLDRAEATAELSGLWNQEVSEQDLRQFEESGILPSHGPYRDSYLLEDLVTLGRATAFHKKERDTRNSGKTLFDEIRPSNARISSVSITDSTEVRLGPLPPSRGSAFCPAFRNLLSIDDGTANSATSRIPYLDGSSVETCSEQFRESVTRQLDRISQASASEASQFARSAYYMGSKRSLAPYLVEGMYGLLGSRGLVVDLMCGSGAASGAFSRYWPTIASDAQTFCRLLATVQGGGSSQDRATDLLDRVVPRAHGHAARLLETLSTFVEAEDALLHEDPDSELQERYQEFLNSFPLYPTDSVRGAWNPTAEVEKRQTNPGKNLSYL